MSSKILDVYLLDAKVGSLIQLKTGRLQFTYNDKWLKTPNARPLSVSLPLRKEEFDDAATRPFFAGLLPDDTVRTKLARILGVSEKNDYALLEELGRECAGAISLYPSGEIPPKIERTNSIAITDEKLVELISVLPARPLLAGLSGLKLSLAGAQNKMAVRVENGKFVLPDESNPSTHIIKPSIQGIDNSITNEFFCMQLAREFLGDTLVPEAEWRSAKGVPYLLIERYDRIVEEGKVLRIHQEDFCQALSIPPEKKYQNEQGPSLGQCFKLLNNFSSNPAIDRLRLTDIVIFNYMIGNTDAHGKNFSFLHTSKGLRLAPFYDLLSTRIYPDLAQKMAMKIGSTYECERVTMSNWDKMASETGMNPTYIRQRLKYFSIKLPKTAANLSEHLANKKLHSNVYAKIIGNITKMSERINLILNSDS